MKGNKQKRKSQYFQFFAGWGRHIAYQTKSGSLWACGRNDFGQCSVGNTKKFLKKPRRVNFFKPGSSKEVKSVSIGRNFTLYLTKAGLAYSSGDNTEGQLCIKANSLEGTSDATVMHFGEKDEPQNFRIIGVFAAEVSSFVITDEQLVYSGGDNCCGHLGHGVSDYSDDFSTLRRIEKLEGIVDIATGDSWVQFLSKTGQIFGCGANGCGPLGLESSEHFSSPTEVTFFSKQNLKVSFAATCSWTTFFITSDNAVYCSGHSSEGEFGNGNSTSCNTKPVVSEPLSGSELYCTGHTDRFFVVKKGGKIFGCGNKPWRFGYSGSNEGEKYVPNRLKTATEVPFEQAEKVVQIVTGNRTTYLICRNGDIYGAGEGSYGQLMNCKVEDYTKFTFLRNVKLRRNEAIEGDKEKARLTVQYVLE